MNWPVVELTDVCDIDVGRTPSRNNAAFWGSGAPWLSIADMNQGREILHTKEQITSEAAKAGKLVDPGTVLLSFKLSIGKVAVAGIPLFTNEAIAALPIKTPNRLRSDYLLHTLRAMNLTSGANRAAMGATLNKAKLQRLRIPLPSLDEQRRIAAILDHADSLRAKRRRVTSLLCDVTRSIFIDMFGDPSRNQRGWERVKLGDIVPEIDSGTSPVCEARPAEGDEWAVLKLGAVSYGTFNPDENKAYLGDTSAMRRSEVRPGDLLFSRKNTKDLVGATAVVHHVPPRRLLPDLIYRLHLDYEKVDSEYLHALLSNHHKRPQLVSLASGSASSMANISRSRLNGLPIELPPLDLQQLFANRIRHTAALRTRAERLNLENLRLFASLQSRAFRGGL